MVSLNPHSNTANNNHSIPPVLQLNNRRRQHRSLSIVSPSSRIPWILNGRILCLNGINPIIRHAHTRRWILPPLSRQSRLRIRNLWWQRTIFHTDLSSEELRVHVQHSGFPLIDAKGGDWGSRIIVDITCWGMDIERGYHPGDSKWSVLWIFGNHDDQREMREG